MSVGLFLLCTKVFFFLYYYYFQMPHINNIWYLSFSGFLTYPLISQWIFRSIPYIGHYKQCLYKQWGAFVFSNYVFLWIYAHGQEYRAIWQLYLQFLRNFHTVLYSGYINLHSYQQHKKVLFSSHPLQHLLCIDFLMMVILIGIR